MSAQLPEAAPVESAIAVPAAVEPAAGRPAWLRSLRIGVPAAVIVVIVAACFVWPIVGSVPKPTGGSILDSDLPAFSSGHLLGTDTVGNDLWSRLLYGGRNSLQIALAVQLVGLILGGTVGAIAGYRGGLLDIVMTRLLDVLIAFPVLVLALAIAQGLGPSKLNTIWALSFFSVPAFARIARAATLQLRERTFMLAATLSGTPSWRILLRHVAPNVLPQLITLGLLGMGIIIILEGALSFLGLGVPPPNPSWGNMIADGQQTLSAEPRFVLYPSVMLFVTVLAFNLLGDALRARWSQA
jgi:peptide/nickel transport system permease protein